MCRPASQLVQWLVRWAVNHEDVCYGLRVMGWALVLDAERHVRVHLLASKYQYAECLGYALEGAAEAGQVRMTLASNRFRVCRVPVMHYCIIALLCAYELACETLPYMQGCSCFEIIVCLGGCSIHELLVSICPDRNE